MKVAKVIFEARFAKIPDTFLYRKRLMRAITGQEQKDEALNESIEFRDKEKGLQVFVHPARFGLSLEGLDVNDWEIVIFDIYKKLMNELNIGNINRIGLRFLSYEKVEYKKYSEFVDDFNKRYLRPESKLVGDSTDSALSLKFEQDNYLVNLTCGPMQGTEISDRTLEFDIKGFPKMYLFSDVDVFTGNISLSNKKLREFLVVAKQTADDVNDKLLTDWGNDV